MPNAIHIASPAKPKSRKPRVAKPQSAPVQPTQEQIQLRAYQIFLERNGAPGNPFEDWTRAEGELLAQPPKTTKSRRASKTKAA
jgi:Protein of unknown function (DUF2934)